MLFQCLCGEGGWALTGCMRMADLGNLDDNLTLPILSGGCLWGFFKLVEALCA